MDSEILNTLRKNFQGNIDTTSETLNLYSHDASLFEMKPEAVLFPKDSKDVQNLVQWLNKNKKNNSSLSITARSAGTDMSGGPINNSIILDFTRYMNKIGEVTKDFAVVEPGCLYRDFDKETRKVGRIMPAYTASREICAVGGMVANNAGGEKSIKYGKAENYLKELKVVFSDGNEYVVKPLTLSELNQKISENSFEGNLYKKPFDLCRLIVGSQGTLGIITEITWKLVPISKFSNLLVVFLPSLEKVSDLVTRILPYKPESLETYDDKSMILAVKFFFDFFKQLGFWKALHLGFRFIPETFMMLSGGVPKLILMIEFTGKSEQEVKLKLTEVRDHLTDFH